MISSKVTVIVPCFNSRRFLGLTLDSILAQSYDDFCVIAVDDGSTDGTATLLESYASRVTVLAHEDGGNHGQAASLNLGVSQTESDYIAFMDADDIWQPDKLLKQAEILDRHQDVGLVYTNGYVIDATGNKLYTLFNKNHVESNGIGAILLNNYIRTPSLVMVRRSLLQTVGPFTVGIIPDQDMWVRIKEISRFYYLDEPLACYREHQGQLSLTSNKKMWIDSLWVLENALQRYPYPKQINNKRRAVIHYRLGLASFQMNDYPAALTYFLKSCWYDPLRVLQHITGRG